MNSDNTNESTGIAAEQVTPDETSKKRSVEDSSSSSAASTAVTASSSNKKLCTASNKQIIDHAVKLGLKPGDRIEVQWQLGNEDEQDDDDDDDDDENVSFRWWPATLLEHDGQCVTDEEEPEKAVAVRILDYDPYPEGGFLERSQEKVFFYGQASLVDLKTEEVMTFRREGEHYDNDEEPIVTLVGTNQMEECVNNIMAATLEKHLTTFQTMSAAQQAFVAERMSKGKEKLLDLMKQTGNGEIVTAEKMMELLAQAK